MPELTNGRKFISKKNIIFFAVLILLSAAVWLFFIFSPSGGTADIEINGEPYKTVNLPALAAPEVLRIDSTLTGGIEITVTADNTGIAVTHSTCPDKTCMKTGKISKAGEAVICLPAKLSITIGGKSRADAVTY